MTRILILVLFIMMSGYGCRNKKVGEEAITNREIGNVIAEMTKIMVHDVTNPPLASRFFSYATLAGYEVVAQHDKGSKKMLHILNDYPDLKKPDSIKNYSVRLAALLSMMETAKKNATLRQPDAGL